ncbi:MAG: D-alanine--D-alanine ligase [Alphaproteobacteria bacterium]|nr:D-alanine--D-alanine ligase [Alphaproteobacteria bacterium]
MSGKKHIAVLMGGQPPERAISLISGAECATSLRDSGYQVSEIDVDSHLAATLTQLKPDIAFNALHGFGGEDGKVQGLLEVMEIPYTHSGVLASALAMNKIQAKKIFAAAGLPIAEHCLVSLDELQTHPQNHPMPPPYVLKPVNQGSSFGVLIIEKDATLPLKEALKTSPQSNLFMAEAYIAGRELTCAVLGERPFEVLEIKPKQGFYDYAAKYDEGGSQHILPADLADSVRAQIQDISLKAHAALGCRGVTRADFRYDADGQGVVILELNTQPGMTPNSLVPKMAKHAGMSYGELVEWIVEDASCLR